MKTWLENLRKDDRINYALLGFFLAVLGVLIGYGVWSGKLILVSRRELPPKAVSSTQPQIQPSQPPTHTAIPTSTQTATATLASTRTATPTQRPTNTPTATPEFHQFPEAYGSGQFLEFRRDAPGCPSILISFEVEEENYKGRLTLLSGGPITYSYSLSYFEYGVRDAAGDGYFHLKNGETYRTATFFPHYKDGAWHTTLRSDCGSLYEGMWYPINHNNSDYLNSGLVVVDQGMRVGCEPIKYWREFSSMREMKIYPRDEKKIELGYQLVDHEAPETLKTDVRDLRKGDLYHIKDLPLGRDLVIEVLLYRDCPDNRGFTYVSLVWYPKN